MTYPSMCQAYLPATWYLSTFLNPCIHNVVFWSSYYIY